MEKPFSFTPVVDTFVIMIQTVIVFFFISVVASISFTTSNGEVTDFTSIAFSFGLSIIVIVMIVSHVGNLRRLEKASDLIKILLADAKKRDDEIMLRLVKEEASELCQLFHAQNHMLSQVGEKAADEMEKRDMAQKIAVAKKSFRDLHALAQSLNANVPNEYQACANLRLSPKTEKIRAEKCYPL